MFFDDKFVVGNKDDYEEYIYDEQSGYKNLAMYSYSNGATVPVCYYNCKNKIMKTNDVVGLRKLIFCTFFVFNEAPLVFGIEDSVVDVSSGGVLVIKNDVSFQTYYPKEFYADYYEVTFPMEFFECFPEKSIFHTLFFDDMKNGVFYSKLSQDDMKRIQMKFDRIDKLIDSHNEFKDILSFSYIVQIVGTICANKKGNDPYENFIILPELLRNAITYIQSNFTEPLNVEDVSKYCSVSGTYLARLFNQYLNCSPGEYINKLRLNYAKTMINDGGDLLEVCYASGFKSYSHFTKKFKEFTGSTPSVYKKKSNKEE